ncbi:MAG: STAS domain-containing protein [Clostridiales bacterium]|nr:STAS domain-containing protein [Clostridiales bacterium]
MNIRSTFEDGRLTIYFEGELDHHAARDALRQIEERIDATCPRETVLDFKGLTFMDSSGIAVVVKAYKRTSQVGGKLSVTNLGPQPRRVLQAAGVERFVRVIVTPKEV